jgi:hypothetical protein
MPDNNSPAAQAVSPKVIASTIAALLVPVVVAVLDATVANAALGAGLGAWAPVAYAGLGALSAAVAGYAVRDLTRV